MYHSYACIVQMSLFNGMWEPMFISYIASFYIIFSSYWSCVGKIKNFINKQINWSFILVNDVVQPTFTCNFVCYNVFKIVQPFYFKLLHTCIYLIQDSNQFCYLFNIYKLISQIKLINFTIYVKSCKFGDKIHFVQHEERILFNPLVSKIQKW